MRIAEEHAPGAQLVEGLDYARAGQTRQIDTAAGLISARVQGRLPQAYRVELRLPVFTTDEWESVIAALGAGNAQAKYAAALMRGELPSNIEDIFAPLGLRLFPSEPSDIATACTCGVFQGRLTEGADTTVGLAPGQRPQPTPWCKHVCCVMYLIAERLSQRPLLAFELRGVAEADLLERLRQQRAISGLAKAGISGVPVHVQHITPPPSESLAGAAAQGRFWAVHDAGDAPQPADAMDLAIEPPAVSHPLLRRLGPSPFTSAKFPLVGLLATCYDLVSRAAIDGSAFLPMPDGADTSSGTPDGGDRV